MKIKKISLEEAEIGKLYKVTMNDCCVDGEFEAVLIFKTFEDGQNERGEHYHYLSTADFSNGVSFFSYNGGVSLTEVL